MTQRISLRKGSICLLGKVRSKYTYFFQAQVQVLDRSTVASKVVQVQVLVHVYVVKYKYLYLSWLCFQLYYFARNY